MSHKIIQWNSYGIKTNWNELLQFGDEPAACLQEKFIKTNDDINIKSYDSNNHIHNTGHRALDGVSILIRNDLPQNKITGIQTIAVKFTSHRTINICTLYILSHDTINEK